MKAYVTSIEVISRGEATLIVEVDFADRKYERNVQLMDKEERVVHLQSDEYQAYREGLREQMSKLRVGHVELVYQEGS